MAELIWASRDGNQGKDSSGWKLYRVKAVSYGTSVFPKPVWGHNDQSDNRGESGCKYCSKHPHSTRKNENIVKHHIKEAPRDRGDHGKLRIAVISHKAENDIVEDKGWGKQHQHLQISGRHLPDFLICTEDGGNPSGKKKTPPAINKREKKTPRYTVFVKI